MRFRPQLRTRILISFVAFGLGLTALFAVATVYMREWLEEELIGSTLQREVAKTAEITRADPVAGANAPFQLVQGWTFGKNKFSAVPFAWQRYGTGVYSISEFDERSGETHYYKLAVNKSDDLWLFLRYDFTEQIKTRRLLTSALVVAVAVFAGLSALVALWLSDRVLQPVIDLAQRVREADRGTPQPLAPHFAADEVGQLAAALDDYSRRLTDLVVRDREFNADVSHELRTPLAVINGATELLLAQNGLPEKTIERIRRIDRAARQSTELTQALLLLSRSERGAPADGEHSEVLPIVEQIVEGQRVHIGSKPVTIRIDCAEPVRVPAPAAVVSVALGNLIGNAVKYTHEGEVLVRVHPDRVDVVDSGPGIDAAESKQLFERGYRGKSATGKGAGLGLAIVRRLCELYRWRVALAPREGARGAVATLWF
jgi:signal transduction histidine kinase